MLKRLIRNILKAAGLELRRASSIVEAGSVDRPIGDLKKFLEDVKTRQFLPAGILDIGANCGNWTRTAKSIFPDARVLMVEPQVEMESQLNGLCAALPRCQYVKAAVGRAEAELVQTIWADLVGSSFLPAIDPSKLKLGEQRLTKVTTIDKLLRENESFQPDLVKLDIQGFEIEALHGGSILFGRTELFIIETSLFSYLDKQPILREVIQFMADRGYEMYDIVEYIRRPHDGALGQVDLAFAKSEGILRASGLW